MYLIDKIPMEYTHRNQILPKLSKVHNEPEMSKDQSAFLCGLLRWKQPDKIVEIGVAAGGTTSIIFQCMKNLKKQYVMYSVDHSAEYYLQRGKKTGFLAEEARILLDIKCWTPLLGNSLPYFIDQIGDGIDFVILDTVHLFPGELLDFLILLPYLQDGAVVCLHDIILNQWSRETQNAEATNILLHTVSGNKIFNYCPPSSGEFSAFPNIAAFQITKETRDNIMDLFLSLTMTWKYLPAIEDIKQYFNKVRQLYDADCCRVFEAAVRMNENALFPISPDIVPRGSRIILYGADTMGRTYFHKLKDYYRIVQWVDRNADSMQGNTKKLVSRPDQADFSKCDFVVIAVSSHTAAEEIKNFLQKKGIEDKKILCGSTCVY